MSDYNGIALSDRTVRHLGIEVANAQITLATQNARLEEIVEAASHINFDLWENTHTHTLDTAHEGGPPPPPPAQQYLVPTYQVEAVARLLALLGR